MTSGSVIRQQAAPLRQRVVEILRQEILDDVLHPGERLLENTLCERYGVSRTVIREAMRQLESERLITMLPNRGPIVTVLTVDDIEALYEVRRALEGLAGELFAERATAHEASALVAHLRDMDASYLHGTLESRGVAKDEFYRLLLDGTHNPVLRSSLSGVHTRIGILRHYAFLDEDRVAVSMHELNRIVHAAAELRDPAQARRTCEEHILGAGRMAIVEYRKHVAAQAAEVEFDAV